MSGNEDREIARELIKNGAEDYIVKGGKKRHTDLLRETIEFAMARHKNVKDLASAAEQKEQCVHWLTGGYSVDS